VEIHSIPILYGHADVFGVKECLRTTVNSCTTLYNCFTYICDILTTNDIDYIGIVFKDLGNLTCSETWLDLYFTLHNSPLDILAFVLMGALALMLVLIAIVGITALIRMYLKIDVYTPLSLRAIQRPYWASRPIRVMLIIANVINVLIAVMVVVTTYIDTFKHMFYSTLWVELSIILVEVFHFIDNHRNVNLASDL
jgi:hypothetical protein